MATEKLEGQSVEEQSLNTPIGERPPGIYDDVAFEDYCAVPAMNISTLTWGCKSMRHLKAALDGRLKKDSEAMAFGRALHAAVLEPNVFALRFAVSNGCEAVLKSGRRKGDYCGAAARYEADGKFLCGAHAPEYAEESDNVISKDEKRRIDAACAAIKEHEVARLLAVRGGYESTLIWEREGVRCKGRTDKLILRQGAIPSVIVDIKKVQVGRGGDYETARSIFDYHYDIKAHWYAEAVHLLTGEYPQFVWIFIEDNEPFGINVVQADAETMAIGRYKCDVLWRKYLDSVASGSWPGYCTNIHLGGLPDFDRKNHSKLIGKV